MEMHLMMELCMNSKQTCAKIKLFLILFIHGCIQHDIYCKNKCSKTIVYCDMHSHESDDMPSDLFTLEQGE